MVKKKMYPVWRKIKNKVISLFFVALAVLSLVALVSIVGNVFHLTVSPLHISSCSQNCGWISIWPGIRALWWTLRLLFIASVIALPFAFGTALFITEYRVTYLVFIVRLFVDILAGIPGILIAIVMYGFQFIVGQSSSNELFISSLIIFLLPKLAKGFAEIFYGVPLHYREAAFAIGSTRMQMVFKVLLPMTFRTLSASVLLGVARTLGVVAPLLLFDSGIHYLPVDIYHLTVNGEFIKAAMYSLFLLFTILLIYLFAAWLDQEIIK